MDIHINRSHALHVLNPFPRMQQQLKQLLTLHLRKFDKVTLHDYLWDVTHAPQSQVISLQDRVLSEEHGTLEDGHLQIHLVEGYIPHALMPETLETFQRVFDYDHKFARLALQQSSRDFHYIYWSGHNRLLIYSGGPKSSGTQATPLSIFRTLFLAFVFTEDAQLMDAAQKVMAVRKLTNVDDVTNLIDDALLPYLAEIQTLTDRAQQRRVYQELQKFSSLFALDLNQLEQRIERVETDYEETQAEAIALLRKLEELRADLFKMEHQSQLNDEPTQELIEYISKYKLDSLLDLQVDKANEQAQIELLTWDPFVNVPELKIVIHAVRTRNEHKYANSKEALRLMELAFVENKIQIPLYGAFRWKMSNKTLDRASDNTSAHPKYIPNFHVVRHNCFGKYKAEFSQALLKRNFIVAFEIMNSACRNINVADGVVFKKFLERMQFDYAHGRTEITYRDKATKELLNVRQVFERYGITPPKGDTSNETISNTAE